jgi:hypothetical protein
MKNIRIDVRVSKTRQAKNYEPVGVTLSVGGDLEDDDFDEIYDSLFESLDAKVNDYLDMAVESFLHKK